MTAVMHPGFDTSVAIRIVPATTPFPPGEGRGCAPRADRNYAPRGDRNYAPPRSQLSGVLIGKPTEVSGAVTTWLAKQPTHARSFIDDLAALQQACVDLTWDEAKELARGHAAVRADAVLPPGARSSELTVTATRRGKVSDGRAGRSVPSSSDPTNAHPTNAHPTNAHPTNAYPTNAYPTNPGKPPGDAGGCRCQEAAMALDRASGLDMVVQGLGEEAQHAAGQSIECQVCVSAVDARGHELYACLHVSQLSTETLWRPCVPRTQVPIDLAEVAPNPQGYRPVLPPRRSTRSGETQSGLYPAKRGNGPRIRVTGRVRSAGGSRSRSRRRCATGIRSTVTARQATQHRACLRNLD